MVTLKRSHLTSFKVGKRVWPRLVLHSLSTNFAGGQSPVGGGRLAAAAAVTAAAVAVAVGDGFRQRSRRRHQRRQNGSGRLGAALHLSGRDAGRHIFSAFSFCSTSTSTCRRSGRSCLVSRCSLRRVVDGNLCSTALFHAYYFLHFSEVKKL